MIIIKKTGFPLMKHAHNAPSARYLRFSMKDQYHASLKNQLLRQKLQLTQTEAETPRVSGRDYRDRESRPRPRLTETETIGYRD